MRPLEGMNMEFRTQHIHFTQKGCQADSKAVAASEFIISHTRSGKLTCCGQRVIIYKGRHVAMDLRPLIQGPKFPNLCLKQDTEDDKMTHFQENTLLKTIISSVLST